MTIRPGDSRSPCFPRVDASGVVCGPGLVATAVAAQAGEIHGHDAGGELAICREHAGVRPGVNLHDVGLDITDVFAEGLGALRRGRHVAVGALDAGFLHSAALEVGGLLAVAGLAPRLDRDGRPLVRVMAGHACNLVWLPSARCFTWTGIPPFPESLPLE